jgi:PTH1 family peptidyl-tRNA hydrolase
LRPPRTGTAADLLVIGLGNPGADYARTRHNIGQDVVELMAERLGVSLKRAMGKALWGHTRVADKLLALGLPGTYMNLSGEGVAPLIRRYGIEDLSRLLVVHDELDLPVGKIQLKLGGGLAGHNGLKSIKHHLKDDGFARLRIGIGRPPGQQSVSDYVLRRPGSADRVELDIAVEHSIDAIDLVLSQNLQQAMNTYNS